MEKTCINENWRFLKEGNEENISLPHTWNGLDGQTGGNDYFRGLCTYEKTLPITAGENDVVYLEFEAANSVANVFVNGAHAGEHIGGYSTFRFDITRLVKKNADNEIKVEVDNAHRDDVYPLMADFTFQGGIYRDVHLIVAGAVHVDLDDDGSSGVYVSQKSVTDDHAELQIDTLLRNVSEGIQDVSVSVSGRCFRPLFG